jgi:hypothetical protein
MINLWTGKGIWEGWRITKYYEHCKFGESILIDPEGNTYSPEDIISNKNISEALDYYRNERKTGSD